MKLHFLCLFLYELGTWNYHGAYSVGDFFTFYEFRNSQKVLHSGIRAGTYKYPVHVYIRYRGIRLKTHILKGLLHRFFSACVLAFPRVRHF